MEFEGYQRQIILSDIGIEGQTRLFNASVLVVGAGGLGCPALQYLVGAGVENICIVEDDLVEVTNLHRQLLYGFDDIGLPKVHCAKKALSKINSATNIIAIEERLHSRNVFNLFSDYDIIMDCSDNFATRYLINDACVLLQKKLVFGAIAQWQGQVAVFNDSQSGINYRDLFPHPPQDGEIKNCAEAGVIGVLPGIIGTMMACEAIKLICGIKGVLSDKIFSFDALAMQSYIYAIKPNPASKSFLPKDQKSLLAIDYDQVCGVAPDAFEISIKDCLEKIENNEAGMIDIRALDERPLLEGIPHLKIPQSLLLDRLDLLTNNEVILFCQSGIRSLDAARLLSRHFGQHKKIHSLRGGLSAYIKYNHNQTHE